MTTSNKASVESQGATTNPPDEVVLAAIDLGTTSCRLLVAKPEHESFRVIDSFSRVVRLGEGVVHTDELQPEAIERAFEALKICHEKILSNHVTRIRAVTTEACRRAKNSDILLDRVKEELGITMEVISTSEEARLALSGCAAVLEPDKPYAIAFDIGGGSTEIMWLRLLPDVHSGMKGLPSIEVIDSISVPYGVVTLSERYRRQFNPQCTYHKVRRRVQSEVGEFVKRNNILSYINDGVVQMAGTSGTVTTLAAINLGLLRYDRRLIDGVYLPLSQIRRISRKILNMTYKARVRHPCIGPGRADLVTMGTAILEGICDCCPIEKLRVADRGVREGILIDLVREYAREQVEKA